MTIAEEAFYKASKALKEASDQKARKNTHESQYNMAFVSMVNQQEQTGQPQIMKLKKKYNFR
jgi:hypothetical protein